MAEDRSRRSRRKDGNEGLIPEVLGKFQIKLRSRIPGRERWEVECIRRRPQMAQRVATMLAATRGVLQVEANPISGRILVLFDPLQFEGKVETLILSVLDRCFVGPLPREEVQPWLVESPIFQVLQHVNPDRTLLAKATAWTVASTVLGFLPTWGFSTLMGVNKAEQSKQDGKAKLWLLGILTAGMNIAEWTVKHHQRQLWKQYASRVEHELRTKAFAHVENLDMAFFDGQNTGQLLSVLSADISSVGRFLEMGPSNAISAVATVALCLLTILYLSPSLAILAALPAIGVLLTSRYFQKRIAPLYAQFGADSAELNRLLSNCLSGIATIKSFVAEDREAKRIEAASDQRRISYERAINASSKNASVMHGMVYSTVSALTVTTGAVYVYEGGLDKESFLTVAQLVPRFFGSMSQIDDIYDTYLNAGVSSERVLKLLEAKSAIHSGTQHLPAKLAGDVEFQHVNFRYQPESDVLKDLNLEMYPGKTVGIVGATGAGKTTIVKLLLRFYDVSDGAVTIDGIDVRSLPVEDLRRSIGFVSQDVYLFDGTVYDNIIYGRPEASMDDVVEAAKAAGAHDFIVKMPQGYYSLVGERGQRLSTGQRQRISIARAVIKNAPMLILDEATASVDNETEAAIHKSIEKVAVGRSMVVIAHRLSTVRNSACIYVIDDGAIREKGTHDELLAAGGLYASLWNVQTGRRTPEV